MIARVESFFRGIRRRLSRSEWAMRHLQLAPSEGTSEKPGLLLIQIDGLGRSHMERAVGQGRMPFLRRLIRLNGYVTHTFYSGLPSTTPAVQAELFYGVRSAVPAFSYVDRRRRSISVMFSPSCASECEAKCAAQSEGLLRGGSSWSNIYTGGAAPKETHFCVVTNRLSDFWRTGKVRKGLLFTLAELPTVFRIIALLLVEFGAAFRAALRGIRSGRRPGAEFSMIFSRVFMATGLRELIRFGAKVDLARGLPVVHVNFIGYDEHAHRRGPGSRFALRSLRAIDRAIKELWREAQKSSRRDYSVWIYSDHGQEPAGSLAVPHAGGIERIVRERHATIRADGNAAPESARGAPASGAEFEPRTGISGEREPVAFPQDDAFVLTAMGPVGHLYFQKPVGDVQRARLAELLVAERGVPGVLFRGANGALLWRHAYGLTRVPDEVPALLQSHPQEVRSEIARDLALWLQHPDTGDLVLVGWSPGSAARTFAPESGSHGGFGPEETRGFALLPAGTPLPPGAALFIRPSALRGAALQHLGRGSHPAWRAVARRNRILRLMTYNTHGCSGMDGRVSPRRIGRVLREQMPDVAALQELDFGRRRSRAEDQAGIIAEEAGLNVVFCPTITKGSEHYGHALFTHWPVEIVRRGRLPGDPRGWWDEPRAALWARIQVAGRGINLVTTHLGLGARERELQIRALLGGEWLGNVLRSEPVILCGDFNFLPGSLPYRIATARLADVQLAARRRRIANTFSSIRPILRLDHVFLSHHFEALAVNAVRNDLTRVASDHLPLVADLRAALTAPRTAPVTARPAMNRTLRPRPAA